MTSPHLPNPAGWFANALITDALIKTNITDPANANIDATPVLATGTAVIPNGSNSVTITGVAFGVTFASAPTPLAFAYSGTINAVAHAYNPTTTTCTVRVFRTDGTNAGAGGNSVPYVVLAIGPRL